MSGADQPFRPIRFRRQGHGLSDYGRRTSDFGSPREPLQLLLIHPIPGSAHFVTRPKYPAQGDAHCPE